MRMAEKHTDPRVRHLLNEIGHRAMDIQGSARENKAVDITREWVSEHGRVLIFTQHTDTVTGLLRRMDHEGIPARSFHGSMSAGERAATIAAFRSGETPIMISTDAGAEGQNLQFCNCVLNFDLPWNPMRIEQRIGRVDRLTQPKDEVFVANLYARGTIDESVYQLLAMKLRMFELLFGQVTTILGELDDSKSASFETRVMEALFADDDSRMEHLLAQLGTELSQARDRASTLIASDSGLSNWMASAFEHRKDLTKAGSSELAPEVSERTRIRQRRVQAWTRRVLAALGAKLLHDTGEGDGAFLTAEFDEDFAEELGGRTVMHLAFDRFGLEQHPNAELCAVGSPVFDELLGLLRMRGDMHATVPVIPEDIGPSPFSHASTLRLLSRKLIPSGSWSGQATFRATIGEAETSEHLITADINGGCERRLARRSLQDGEKLPAAFDVPPKVIRSFEKSAATQLEELRHERSMQVESDQSLELDRIRSGYTAQIYEANYEDRRRLERALASEERRLDRRPDIRARAKLLAVTLDEDDWIVEEVWAGPGEVEARLTYEWDCDDTVSFNSTASGDPITVLALCSNAHWIDESEVAHCESCARHLCQGCGDDGVIEGCPVCTSPTCRACRKRTGGLCARCGSPERAPEFDEKYAIAWVLNRGARLLVGERIAELTRPDGTTDPLVPKGDIAHRERVRIRAYASEHQLPLDTGLQYRDLTVRPRSQSDDRIRVAGSATVDVELTNVEDAGSVIAFEVAGDVPAHPDARVRSEQEFRLGTLLQVLRLDVPPPSPPAILLTRRSTFTDFYLDAEGLVKEITVVGNDGELATNTVEASPLHWIVPSVSNGLVATAELDDLRLSVEARNEALVVEIHQTGSTAEAELWVAAPDVESLPYQLGCLPFFDQLGRPGARLAVRTDEAPAIQTPFVAPSKCTLVSRDIKPVTQRVEVDVSSSAVTSAGIAALRTLGIAPDDAATENLTPIPDLLGRSLLATANRPFTDVLCNGFEVTETWKGHGTATHTYRTFDGRSVCPPLDDSRSREADFDVCSVGHFCVAGTTELCGSCHSWACRACDPVDGQATVHCTGCSTSVCRRCSESDHVVPQERCLLCDDRACRDCGRDPGVASCPSCERTVCSSCRVGDICPACSTLCRPTEHDMDSLPSELGAAGASMLVGTDADATVVFLNRGDASERALVRNGTVSDWHAFGQQSINTLYRLRIVTSRCYAAQMVPSVEPLVPEPPLPEPHLVVEDVRTFRTAWSAPELLISGIGRQLEDAAGELSALVVDEFPPCTLIPQAVPHIPPAVAEILKRCPAPSTSELKLRWERRGHVAAITKTGIVETTFEDSITQVVASWEQESTELPPWVSDAWNPVPHMRSGAVSRHVEAAIVELASLRVLGVRHADKIDWFVVRASENAVAATALARSMSLGDADGVAIYTNPGKLNLSHVKNATSTRTIRVDPVGTLTTGSRSGEDMTPGALSCWAPTAPVTAPPNFQNLPSGFANALEGVIGLPPALTMLGIGARLEQLVTVKDGTDWLYVNELKPGRTDARRINRFTGMTMDVGVIDREGHFAFDEPPCPYCGGLTCGACEDAVVPCSCCTTRICKRCAHRPTDDRNHGDRLLCPACMSTRPPTRKEAREHGRLFMTRRMLIGTDAQHTVVFELSKNQWALQTVGSDIHITSAEAADFLNQRLNDPEHPDHAT